VCLEAGEPKLREATVFGKFGPFLEVVVMNSSLEMLLQGIIERVFLVKAIGPEGENIFVKPPEAEKGFFNLQFKTYRNNIRRKVGLLTPMTHLDFCELYAGQKRLVLIAAAEMVMKHGLDARDLIYKAFGKYEKLFLKPTRDILDEIDFAKLTEPKNVMRIIQFSSKKTNVELGRRIKPLENVLYKAIDKCFGGSTVRKGKNARETGRMMKDNWDHFDDPVAVLIDLKRYDQHVGRDCIKEKQKLYQHAYPDDEVLGTILQAQRNSTVKFKTPEGHGIYEKSRGTNSGEQDTSLGMIYMVCGMIYSFLNLFLPCSRGMRKWKVANDGDDFNIIVERKDAETVLENIASYFLKFGHEVDVEGTTDDFYRVTLCKTRPVFDGTDWIATPLLGSLSTASVTLKNVYDKQSYDLYRNSIGQCGMAAYGDMPVYGAYYRMMSRGAGAKVEASPAMTGLTVASRGMNKKGKPVLEQTRYHFWRAHGIDPYTQRCLEREYDNTDLMWAPPPTFDSYQRANTIEIEHTGLPV
jgi:hypothetical protein